MFRGKSVELEQVSEAWRVSQRVQRECEDRHNYSLRERDTLINQLQTTLHTHTKEAEVKTGVICIYIYHTHKILIVLFSDKRLIESLLLSCRSSPLLSSVRFL